MRINHLPKIAAYWLGLLLIIFMSGCSAQDEIDSELSEKIAETKQNSIEKAKKIQIEPPTLPATVKFNAPSIKAPFEKKSELPVNAENINVSPLLAYPVTMLKLVGTVNDGSITFAYILAPNQMVYRVDQGDILGDKKGKVVAITPGRIDVMVLDEVDGAVPIQRKIVLELKDEP